MERICGVPAEEAVGLPYNEWLARLDPDGKPVRLEDLLAAATPERPRASAEVQIRTTVSHELRTPSPRSRATGRSSRLGAQPVRGQAPGHAPDRGRAGRPPGPAGRGPPAGLADLLRAGRHGRGRHAARVHRPGRGGPPGGRRLAARPRQPARAGAAPGPLEVDADPLRLVQVLANLVSNAHKYSPADQEVRLRVWRDNGWALAAVADRGRGIPREELDRVFEKSTGSRTR